MIKFKIPYLQFFCFYSVAWSLGDERDPSNSTETLSVNIDDIPRESKVSCSEGSMKLAEINSEHIYQLCYPGTYENLFRGLVIIARYSTHVKKHVSLS